MYRRPRRRIIIQSRPSLRNLTIIPRRRLIDTFLKGPEAWEIETGCGVLRVITCRLHSLKIRNGNL